MSVADRLSAYWWGCRLQQCRMSIGVDFVTPPSSAPSSGRSVVAGSLAIHCWVYYRPSVWFVCSHWADVQTSEKETTGQAFMVPHGTGNLSLARTAGGTVLEILSFAPAGTGRISLLCFPGMVWHRVTDFAAAPVPLPMTPQGLLRRYFSPGHPCQRSVRCPTPLSFCASHYGKGCNVEQFSTPNPSMFFEPLPKGKLVQLFRQLH